MQRIRLPRRSRPQPKAVDLDDLRKLFAATDDTPLGKRNRAMLAVFVDTGCRAGGWFR
jgi:site-specific recombinase XerC